MLKEIAYYDGVWGSPGELKLPLEDRGYLFGEGVYDALLSYNHIPFAMDDHLDRLEASLEKMEMRMPMTRSALKAVIEQGIARVEGEAQLIYFQITRGGSTPRKHSYLNVINESKLMLTVRPFADGQQQMHQGLTAITYPDIRWQHCDIKTVSLIPNAMAATAAERAGVYTAILHHDGTVSEGASQCACIVKDGILYTAPLSNLILPSITRQHVVEHAAEWDLDLREEYFTVEQMLAADEVMMLSATRHPSPIVSVDGRQIGDGRVGPIAWKIYRHYEAMIAAVCGPRKYDD